ncbi:glycosyltransferase family 2 protein [Candidatus Woesearchaeota archaeon]|nr:glycosyltransferase family 2 protein [Candidatus Woesearchaeota archaeon]
MKLSIIIPVYNEKETILKILKKVEDIELKYIEKEIIIVDDFSTDGTRDILKSLEKHKIFFHEKNIGKGGAIRTGLKYFTGDIVLFQDADLEYDPKFYNDLLKPILNNETKVVYGSRMLGEHKDMYSLHYFGNNFLTIATNFLFNCKISDMETCYKVFKKEVLEGISLKSEKFDFEPEITAKILKKGYKIKEVPIDFKNPRDFEQGKKITWKDGVMHFYYLLKYRFFD